MFFDSTNEMMSVYIKKESVEIIQENTTVFERPHSIISVSSILCL